MLQMYKNRRLILGSPLEVVTQCVNYWQNHQKKIDIAQVEGFVRQIIGWREYMRGVYWAQMPGFATLNFFNHQANLPTWFWTGYTSFGITCFAKMRLPLILLSSLFFIVHSCSVALREAVFRSIMGLK